MAVSAETLIELTRVKSGLRNNRLFTDTQILDLLNQAYAALRDLLIVRFAAWFKAEYQFTLTNGTGNVLDLSLIPDFQMAQGLDLLNGTSPPFTVPMLDSFAERNQYNNLWPLGVGWSFNGYLGRRYWIDGDSLTVYPSTNAAGNYNLIYTPMLAPLLPEQTATFNIGDSASIYRHDRPVLVETGDHVAQGVNVWVFANGDFDQGDVGIQINIGSALVNGLFTIQTVISDTTIITIENPAVTGDFTPADTLSVLDSFGFAFPEAEFTPDMVGGELIVDFTNPADALLNGTYTIYATQSATTAIIRIFGPTLATHNPTAGSITVNWQPPFTVPELPQPLTPWSEYLVLYASLSIRTSRQQQTADLEMQFQQISQRIVSATKQRSEGIRQAPLTRGWGGYGSGGGWR